MDLKTSVHAQQDDSMILPLPMQGEATPVRQRRAVPVAGSMSLGASFDGTVPPSEQRRQARAATAQGFRSSMDVAEHSPLRFSEPQLGMGAGAGAMGSGMGTGSPAGMGTGMGMDPMQPGSPLRSSFHSTAGMGLGGMLPDLSVSMSASRPGTAQPLSASGLRITVDDPSQSHAALASLAMSPTLQPGHLEHVKDSRFLSLFADENALPDDQPVPVPVPRLLPPEQPPAAIGSLRPAEPQPRQPEPAFTDVTKARSSSFYGRGWGPSCDCQMSNPAVILCSAVCMCV